jgi:hypothetical protein
MKNITRILVILVVVLMAGCVSIPPAIDLAIHEESNDIKVGVLLAEPKQAEPHFTGSIGLFDLAVIYAMNKSLSAHLKTLEFKTFSDIRAGFVNVLEEKGFIVDIIEKPLPKVVADKLKLHKNGKSSNDYSSYADKYDYILLIRIGSIGTTRDYYGPIPTSEPIATATLIGELVDIDTGRVYWYQNILATKLIPEPWDEKEQGYPNLTNAVYVALNDSAEKLKASLVSNASNKKEQDLDSKAEIKTSGNLRKSIDSSFNEKATRDTEEQAKTSSVL